ncbi:class II aldolase/adducin family protein [Ohessyouella blattaphilus]|uniref:Class II aldolase/adducin family protein n=1 Tax=Ohessyouella blattaphilus TaxID=2949333 RepID=A0ABT1EI87_9FIRM|nr:class II aldolase/adducin family protein [Ohessyouella blattaphilus]MCP1110411.1 class II aldolase/adducin family protein [Ohessyouella blattaphilus]MCR8563805.1 class II aldolase/adducin family protein [Ohessyouella blattaphilus]
MRYLKERQKLIDCARKMEQQKLVMMSGGNVALRLGEDAFLVTPSAISYDVMVPGDIVMVNSEGEVLEGTRRPTSDLKALLYIFENMPEVNVVLHTHQPKAVAVSLVTDKLPLISTTMVDELHGEVMVAPFTISSDQGMGEVTVAYAGKALAVILKQHGIMAYGRDLEQALSAAIYLEETCEVYLSVLATGREVPVLTKEQIAAEEAPRGYYGQP